MKSLLRRWLPFGWGGAAAPEPPVATERRRVATAVEAAPGASPDPPDAEALTALLAIAARRPVISAGGEIVGFEFRISDDIVRRLKRRSDQRAQAAHVAAALASARLVAKTGRLAFARFPVDWLLLAGTPEHPAGLMLGIEQPSMASPEPEMLQAAARVVQRLHGQGARVGWDASYVQIGQSVFGLRPSFVLLRQGSAPLAALLAAARSWPPALQGLPTLATDLASVEDLEAALEGGVTYVCGALARTRARPEAQEHQAVPPEVARIGHLMHLLLTEADLSEIVSDIKGDVGLSFRLLSRMNSASFAQLDSGASIDQAVLLLGRNELYRWLSVLLLQFAGSRKVSSALEEVALWRSRLLELLALERHESAPGQLFTLGLASMLGVILKISPTDVVQTLRLAAPARAALLEQSGPWNSYLELAACIEAQTLAQAGALTEPFGGAARVAELSDAAWEWAAQHAERPGERKALGPAQGATAS